MGAYNRTNGEPCCASPTLLQQILRNDWGFAGHVVSDCEAITDIYAHHKIVETPAQAAALAVNNGCDLECGCVFSTLIDAVDQGLINEATIDRSVGRLLETPSSLGSWQGHRKRRPPPRYRPMLSTRTTPSSYALEAARESIVLLQNDGLLPLAKTIESVAVVGPQDADDLLVI